jgi:hypothetical protein
MENNWEEVIDRKIKEAKERNAKKRGWVVLRKSWLTSSINYRMTLEEIAVFSKLIVMADEFGPVPGLISDNDCRAMPHDYLAHQACAPIDIFESMLKKAIEDDSIYENGHGIFLTHFDDYQFTEYDRQKKYRQAHRQQLRMLDTAEVDRENKERIAKWEAEHGRKGKVGDDGES